MKNVNQLLNMQISDVIVKVDLLRQKRTKKSQLTSFDVMYENA